MFNFKLASKPKTTQDSSKPKSKISSYAIIGLVVAILGGAAYWYLNMMDEPPVTKVSSPASLPKPAKPKVETASAVQATQPLNNPAKKNSVESEVPFDEMHSIFCKMDKKQITNADVNRYAELNHAVEKMMSTAKVAGTKEVVELTNKIDKSMDKVTCN